MQLEIADRRLVVDIVGPLVVFLDSKAQTGHDPADIFGAGGIKQDVVVGHLTHAEAGIEVLHDHALEGHVPDTGPLQFRQDGGPVPVQQKGPALGLRDRLFKAGIPAAGGLQGHSDRGCQHVKGRRLVDPVQVQSRDQFRVGHSLFDRAGTEPDHLLSCFSISGCRFLMIFHVIKS